MGACPPENPAKLAEKIEFACCNPELSLLAGRQSLQAADHYEFHAQLEKFRSVLTSRSPFDEYC